jgi:gamma-carbonic anhydrase
MPLAAYQGVLPQLKERVFLAPDAWLTGRVFVDENVTILFGVVARGDINDIIIGARSNIQDHVVLHTTTGLGACRVGADVTVGHHAVLHSCTVKDRCIIGMSSTILDGAVIGEDCIVGAHSLVTMNTIIPPRSLVLGAPAKVARPLTDAEVARIKESAQSYQAVGAEYQKSFK